MLRNRSVSVAIVPQPVISEGVAVKDDIVVCLASWDLNCNDVPSWVPLPVEVIRKASVEFLNGIGVNVYLEVCVDVAPDYCEIVVAHISSALPVEGGH